MSKKPVKVPIFSTKTITSIKDLNTRIKMYFALLKKLEICIVNDPEIVHKAIYVEIDTGKMYLMDLSALYLNCTFWIFNITLNSPISEDDVHDLSEATKKTFIKIMDKIISKFLKLGYDLDSFKFIGTIKEKIIRIARFYGEICANTFSLYDTMAFEARSPEFSEIFNKKLDPNMPATEVEVYLERAKDRFYELVNEDKQYSLYPFISTKMVKNLQIGQIFCAVGTRQDIDTSILPVIIKTGWIHGMSDVSEFYVEAVSTRNSIIVKKEAVPDSGYLSRKVNIDCLNTHTDSRIYDCGTKHYLSYMIPNKDHLKVLEGKYMLIDEKGPKFREIGATDYDLVGKTVRLRSHTKCITGHSVNKVCSICLGNKHNTLKDARIGGLVSIKLINPITQLGMSAKHASTTKSEEITGDIFKRYFVVSKTNIYPKKDASGQLLIRLDYVNDILSSETIIDDNDYENGLDFSKLIDMILIVEDGNLRGLNLQDKNFFVNISDALISVISNHTGDIVKPEDVIKNVIDIESESDIDWENEFEDVDFISIDLDELDGSEPVFTTKLLTEEVSRYLKITKNIIDGVKTSSYTRPEDMIYDIVDILFKAKLNTSGQMIHIESLVMNLMRDINNPIKRVDYSGAKEPAVQFVKLTQSIQNSDLFSGICFQDLKRNIELADTLEKGSPGIFDIFFKNSVYEENGEEFKKTRPYLFKSKE